MSRPQADTLRLDPLAYDSLRQQILRRDGWRCQSCGTMSNLKSCVAQAVMWRWQLSETRNHVKDRKPRHIINGRR